MILLALIIAEIILFKKFIIKAPLRVKVFIKVLCFVIFFCVYQWYWSFVYIPGDVVNIETEKAVENFGLQGAEGIAYDNTKQNLFAADINGKIIQVLPNNKHRIVTELKSGISNSGIEHDTNGLLIAVGSNIENKGQVTLIKESNGKAYNFISNNPNRYNYPLLHKDKLYISDFKWKGDISIFDYQKMRSDLYNNKIESLDNYLIDKITNINFGNGLVIVGDDLYIAKTMAGEIAKVNLINKKKETLWSVKKAPMTIAAFDGMTLSKNNDSLLVLENLKGIIYQVNINSGDLEYSYYLNKNKYISPASIKYVDGGVNKPGYYFTDLWEFSYLDAITNNLKFKGNVYFWKN